MNNNSFPDSNTGDNTTERLPNELNDIILYQGTTGNVRVEIYFQDETFWLNQKRMADLFGVEISTINYHLKERCHRGRGC